jgi:serine/threonine protein kinase/TolB-like protein
VALQLLEELRDALQEHYAVESEVGRGGMATVFLAEDLKHGRRVAIKVLSPELSSSIDSDRFKREIQIAARLSHPHILPVFDSGDANGLLYYVMPFVEGESLRGRLKRETQLSIEDAITITCEVADALSYAHAFGVVHRDIKPENILLHGGHAVVADFGIARVIQDAGGEKLTQTGMSVGTAAYMSPEQFSGENIDGRSDVYSLACVLYEMLVGEVPFTGPNAIAIMARHTMEMPPSIQIVRGTVADELEGAIMHALEKVPADRFATVAQFKEAILGQGATSTYARRTRAYTKQHTAIPTPAARRRRRTLAGGAVAIAFLATGSLASRYYWVKAHGPSVTQAGDVARALSPRRIAVLYFDDQTKDGSVGHVASGLTESLIKQLSQVDGLDVISPGGVAPFQKSSIPSDSIARALRVGTLVAGSLQDDGNQLRVSVQLVDGESGTPFARQSFRVPRQALLNARDSLSGAVSDLLRRRLGEEVRLREQQSETSNPDAWALVQRVENLRRDADARFAAGDPTGASQQLRAADSLAMAAALADPHWLEPVNERAAIAYRRARLTKDPREGAPLVDSAMAQTERALAVDGRNPTALELRGTLRYYRVQRGFITDQHAIDQAVADAETDLRQAVAIAPRQATAWNELSIVQYGKKNVVESNLAARRAYEADAYLRAAPEILFRLWATSYDLEQFPDAIHWCALGQQRFRADPRFVRCQLFTMFTKAVAATPTTAWSLVKDLERVTPKQEWEYSRREAQLLVAIVLGQAGLVDSAHHVIASSHAGPDIDPRGELLGLEALGHTYLGERAQAITLLEEYLTNHPEHRGGFGKVNAWWWRDLQNEPRFKALAASGR